MADLHSGLYDWNSLLPARRSVAGRLLLYIKAAVMFLTCVMKYPLYGCKEHLHLTTWSYVAITELFV